VREVNTFFKTFFQASFACVSLAATGLILARLPLLLNGFSRTNLHNGSIPLHRARPSAGILLFFYNTTCKGAMEMNHPIMYQEKLRTAEEAVLLIEPQDDIIVPLSAGEPPALLDALPGQMRLRGNRLFQMLSLRPCVGRAGGANSVGVDVSGRR
jgi:hypothetical protein